MIEDRVLRLEAQMRGYREKIDAMWVDFKTWRATRDKKVAAQERARCAKFADAAKVTGHPEEMADWNRACDYVAQQIRTSEIPKRLKE